MENTNLPSLQKLHAKLGVILVEPLQVTARTDGQTENKLSACQPLLHADILLWSTEQPVNYGMYRTQKNKYLKIYYYSKKTDTCINSVSKKYNACKEA